MAPTLKVITGGQTGVDTGALLSCVANGIAADALFPLGLRREPPQPGCIDAKKLAKMLIDAGGRADVTDNDKYDHRTREVIRRTQALLVISPALDSTPGTRLTYKVASDAGHQVWVFRTVHDKAYWKAEAHAVGYWLKSLLTHWKIDGRDGINLMVAGPRATKWAEGEKTTGIIMDHVIEELKSK